LALLTMAFFADLLLLHHTIVYLINKNTNLRQII
jgi:hypothetical protein